jgi:hypothetical protein
MSHTQPVASSSRAGSYTSTYRDEEPVELETTKPKGKDSDAILSNYALPSTTSPRNSDEASTMITAKQPRWRTLLAPILRYERARRIWLYIRGPRPKQELPGE